MDTKTLSSLKQQKHPWLELPTPLEQLVQIPWKLPSDAVEEKLPACFKRANWTVYPPIIVAPNLGLFSSLAVTVVKWTKVLKSS